MIEKQLISRRERHLEALNYYEKDYDHDYKQELIVNKYLFRFSMIFLKRNKTTFKTLIKR